MTERAEDLLPTQETSHSEVNSREVVDAQLSANMLGRLGEWLTSSPGRDLKILTARDGPQRARAVAAAQALYARAAPRRIPICNEELPHCNDRCIHCGVAHIMRAAEAMPFSAVVQHLKSIAQTGQREVMFAVSELSIRPDFLAILRTCRRLGFTTVAVVTNGRRFAYPEFSAAAVKAGATHFLVSVYGSTARIHQAITRTPGSFEQTWAGLRELLATGAKVMTNTVVTRRNLDHLPDLVDALADAGATRMCFSFVQIIGAAADHASSLVPTLTEAAPHIREAVQRALDRGAAPGIGGMPYCILPDLAPYFGVDDLSFIHNDRHTDQITHRSPYHHAEPCGRCAVQAWCLGAQAEYLQRFGVSELRPFAGPLSTRRPRSVLGASMFPELFR